MAPLFLVLFLLPLPLSGLRPNGNRAGLRSHYPIRALQQSGRRSSARRSSHRGWLPAFTFTLPFSLSSPPALLRRGNIPAHSPMGREYEEEPPLGFHLGGGNSQHGFKSLLQFLITKGGTEERELVHEIRVAASKLIANITELEASALVAMPEKQLLSLINAHYFAAAQRENTKRNSVGGASVNVTTLSTTVAQNDEGWTFLLPIDTEKERQKLSKGYRDAMTGLSTSLSEDISKPSPTQSPRMVVESLLKALARVDIPTFNNGIKVMRNFMHPSSTLQRFKDDEELRRKIEETNYRCLLNNRDFMWYREPLKQRGGEIVEIKTKVLESEAKDWVEIEWVLEVLNSVWYLRQVRTRI